MSKKLLVKVSGIVMALVIGVFSFIPTNVYAMESVETNYVSTRTAAPTVNASYGTTLAYMREWTIKDNSDNSTYNSLSAPSIKLPNDARIHRVILKFTAIIPGSDQGIGGEKITVTLTRPNGTKIVSSGTISSKTEYQTIQLFFNGVSSGELLKVNIDASSSGSSNGYYRTIYIQYGQVYCD